MWLGSAAIRTVTSSGKSCIAELHENLRRTVVISGPAVHADRRHTYLEASLICTPLHNPRHKSRFFVQLGGVKRGPAVVVSGREVGTVFGELGECLGTGVSFGGKMGSGSAAGAAGVDVGSVREQPGHGSMIPLIGERLQRRARIGRFPVDFHSPS